MYILLLSDVFTFSGVGNYMNQLSVELSARGHKVVMASSNILRTDVNENITLVKMPPTNEITSYIKKLREIVKEYNITVIHSNHRRPTFLVNVYNHIYNRIPVVWTCHTVPYPNNFIKRIMGYYGDVSIAISSEAYAWMKSELRIKENHINTILNGVDNKSLNDYLLENKRNAKNRALKKYFRIDSGQDDYTMIAMHGRIDPVKGIDVLIDSIEYFDKEALSKIRVICSGDIKEGGAYYDALVDNIERKGLKDNFCFIGWSDANEVFSACDIMVQPSRREGFPLSSVEAFLMNTPVIRTKVGGFVDMKDYCIGIEKDDSRQLYLELKKFMENRDGYADMIKRARDWALNNCTIEIMANKTIEAYEKAINYREN